MVQILNCISQKKFISEAPESEHSYVHQGQHNERPKSLRESVENWREKTPCRSSANHQQRRFALDHSMHDRIAFESNAGTSRGIGENAL